MTFDFKGQYSYLTSSISVIAIAIGLVAGQSTTQKSLAQISTINGAGSTLAAPLYVGIPGSTDPNFTPKGSWFNVYGQANPASNPPAANPPGPINNKVTFRYAVVGNEGGLIYFLNNGLQTPAEIRPISFGATEYPLSGKEEILNQGGVSNSGPAIQVPVALSGITLAYNRTGLTIPPNGRIQLSRTTYLAILNGSITNWNDNRIRNDNGGKIIAENLPIRVIYRSDASGTTFALTSHLKAAFGAAWNRGVGKKSTVQPAPNPPVSGFVYWPATFLPASGDGGLATKIAATPGAIGYVDNATLSASSQILRAALENKAGNYISASSTSISAAFEGVTDTDSDDRRIRITVADPTATSAYPIVTATYLLFYSKYANQNISTGIKGFINWALAVPPFAPGTDTNPNQIVVNREYAPLPDGIKNLARNIVQTFVKP